MDKKGQVQQGVFQLLYLAIGILVVGIVVAYGATYLQSEQTDILNDVKAASCGLNASGGTAGAIQFTKCPAEYNATVQSLNAMQDVGEGQSTITTVGILAVVIALLLGVVALFGFMRGRE
jgi:hypothetical protein